MAPNLKIFLEILLFDEKLSRSSQSKQKKKRKIHNLFEFYFSFVTYEMNKEETEEILIK